MVWSIRSWTRLKKSQSSPSVEKDEGLLAKRKLVNGPFVCRHHVTLSETKGLP
jgi:hypothetical protein